MVNGVITREGELLSVEEALNNSFKLGYSASFITAAVNFATRKWNGKAHPTDIVTCPRQAALKYTEDFPIKLEKTVDAMIGTSMHRFFKGGDHGYDNVKCENEIMNGEIDLIEIVDNSFSVIYDFKVVKSFPVKKALGIYADYEPLLDEDGNQTYFKSGAKKGQPRTKKVIKQDFSKRDVIPYTRQLNIYRYLLETGTIKHDFLEKFPIKALRVSQFLKEAGKIAAQNGIEHSSYDVPIPIVDDEIMVEFIGERGGGINNFMAGSGDLPPIPDNPNDVWDGRLCRDFCQVADKCKKYANDTHPYL